MGSKIDVCETIKGKQLAIPSNEMSANFECKFQPCLHESPQFSRTLNQVSTIHNLEPGIPVVFQVAHEATSSFIVSGDLLEINICGYLRCI